jgi:Flp pilus assembly protein TadG
MPRPFKCFRRDKTGVASVEFALLGTVLLLIFAGSFDVVYMVSARRDADRASMLIAHAMATCPNSSCMSELINTYLPRKANALIRYPTAPLDIYLIQNQNGTIKPCSGTSTTLSDDKLIASAKNLLRSDDVGSAVMMTTSYLSILPSALLTYISPSGVSYTGRTVDVMGNVGAVC